MVVALNDILEGLQINAKCVDAQRHRHLAFYDVKLDLGCRVRKLELYSREIALALQCKTSPIVTAIPEKGIVRLRVAMEAAPLINFDELYKNASVPKGILPFLLGESDNGQILWADMAMHPHMLVAGASGSGKSTLLHTLVANAIKREDVWLYLVDPKQGVEFGLYEEEIANILCTDYSSTIFMLEQVYKEMEQRYSILQRLGLPSIEQRPNIFPKILVIIDEVSDLMMYDSNRINMYRGRFEELLILLAQKSRAAGIYIVLATQRPSVDVITGLIKANFPARLACKVSSGVDSKVILDQNGAESLLGRGDAILNNYNQSYTRFQVAYSSPTDLAKKAA